MDLLHTLRKLLRQPDFYALSLGHGPAPLASQRLAEPDLRASRRGRRS